jgi:large subunit ribosomal protein L23
MPLFNKIKNIFKKPKKEVLKKEKIKKVKEETSKVAPVKKVTIKKKLGEVYRILKEPHISEKSTKLFDEGKYTFKVFSWANKTEIKKAVSDLYGVRVKDVKIVNIKPKSRTLRGLRGKKRGYKKAIVILEKGEKIEIMPH